MHQRLADLNSSQLPIRNGGCYPPQIIALPLFLTQPLYCICPCICPTKLSVSKNLGEISTLIPRIPFAAI